MPIIVKDFTWSQTNEQIIIQVPLHSVPPSAVDIFTTEAYVKVSFEYFIFECFPLHQINPDLSKAIKYSDKVVLHLKKVDDDEEWPTLEQTLTKTEKKEIKTSAIKTAQEKLSKEQENKRSAYYQLKRDFVTLAVAEDTKTRDKITEIKEIEKANALGDIAELKMDTKRIGNKKSKKIYEKSHKSQKSQHFEENKKVDIAIPMPRNHKINKNDEGAKNVVEVEFTPRVLPTPSRESQAREENEWLAKQNAARRTAGFVSEDLRPEEKNPDYILLKGKNFLDAGNYLGAISAFTFGIEISPNFVDWYICRSRAHFNIGNYHKCVHDCSTAIDIMKPEVYANLTQRVECIHRRGMALFKLGLKREAADEVKAAIALQPSRELTRDLYEILDSKEYVEKPGESLGLKEIDHSS